MGKKKGRLLDKFYFQAKTAGYRSRAAFKLIQLNRKYNFLPSSRVCIDLCAAPGSWMQVATRYMPVSSVIIGIDRYSIVPIPNTIGLQGDITTEKVRQDIRARLKTWKADVVLHDGAPHVGSSWIQDAYQQNLLVLHAFKLACEFLRKDGTFVTKIFRSRDHFSLQYIFRKLFKRVITTKPIASRSESAEIFVVCLGFIAPDKVDPQFFDPKHVFETLETEPTNKIDLQKPEKVKRKAEGYEEGITMLFSRKKISDFIHSSDHLKLLEVADVLEWDLPAARESVHTTNEIIELCRDIKVLGRRDLRRLMNWRKAVKAELEAEEEQVETVTQEPEEHDEKTKVTEVDDEMEELKAAQEEIAKLKSEKTSADKKRQKKLDKKKKKLQEKMNLCLKIPGDPGPQEKQDGGLFSLNHLNKVSTLDAVLDQSAEMVASDSEEETGAGPKYRYYSKTEPPRLDSSGFNYKTGSESDTEEDGDGENDARDKDALDSDDEGLRMDKEERKEAKRKKSVTFEDQAADDSESDDDNQTTNPILTDLVGDRRASKRERQAEIWLSRDIFQMVGDDEDAEDTDVGSAINSYRASGGQVIGRDYSEDEDNTDDRAKGEDSQEEKVRNEFNAEDAPDSSDSHTDSDSDSGVDAGAVEEATSGVKEEPKKKEKVHLSNHALALATQMIHSKKAKRDLEDDGWNKYMLGDENLPCWFVEDEKQFNNPWIPVDQEDMQIYQNRDKSVDARTMKKVVEAKARKKKRASRRFKKLRKLVDDVTRHPDMTAREKAIEMKKIYNKAFTMNKTTAKKKNYLVMKKSYGGKRPGGTKGPVKLVDRRMKKDKKTAERVANKKKKSAGFRKPPKQKPGKKYKKQKTEQNK